MKEDNLHQSFDDFFKDGFEDFSPTPPSENWEKIASELEGEAMDDLAKNQFDQLEIAPPPKVWNNIKRKLPLSLLLRNQLNWLSRIAAVLIIFMIVLLVLDKKDITPTEPKIAEATIIETIEESQAATEPVDFVFAIDENTNQNAHSASEELSLEDEKTIEDFWSDVMDEEEEFLAEVDEEVIEESLKPILELPIENLQAALPKNISKKQLPTTPENKIELPDGAILSDEK